MRSPLAKRPRLEQLNIHFLDVLSAIPDFGGRLAQYLWSTRETQFQDPLWKLSGMQEGINGKPILITSHLPRLLCASSAMQLSLVVGIKERRGVSLKEGSLKLQTSYSEMLAFVERTYPQAWANSRRLRMFTSAEADFEIAGIFLRPYLPFERSTNEMIL